MEQPLHLHVFHLQVAELAAFLHCGFGDFWCERGLRVGSQPLPVLQTNVDSIAVSRFVDSFAEFDK